MYSIDEPTFLQLKPFLLLPDSLSKYSQIKSKSKDQLDLASADSAQLVSLRGIGPALASRIIHYRESLGGFYSIDQLKEVYGITDSTFEIIQSQITLSDTSLRKIHPDQDSLGVLSAHPYLRYKIARAIVNYRRQHGIHSLSELQSLPFVPAENLRKLAPYLEFQN
jgi:competence ComEA-like helix-hairpin-helix protein